jgi:glycerol-3-phosphate dehydrogenase
VTNTQFDLIVIGAGINGAGIARDAAMRGLIVLLLDKGDIAGGTSSFSTRLIHGGLRYLEHGEFGLVRESLNERECLLRTAPHLVRPLPMLLPIYRNSRRGWWTVRAGMLAYDALSLGKSVPRHRMLECAEALREAPGLNREGLLGAATYYDAQVEFAERLVLENVLAAQQHGATVVTYATVKKLIVVEGKVTGVELKHNWSGETETVHGAIVINAAGPWVDEVLENSSPRLIGGTKGSHLVVSSFSGAPAMAIYVEAAKDRRPFFIIPWQRNFLIGTTDLRFEGDAGDAHINDEEIDYLLQETNRVLPAANLSRKEILFAYSGVRPLPFTADGDAPNITRRHFIREQKNIYNLFSIVGGKLTTYRSLAEQAVDLVLKKLGRHPVSCTTGSEALPGAATADWPAFRADFTQRSFLSSAINERLLRIYGTRAVQLLELVEQDRSLARVFDDETNAIEAEILFSFKEEFARTLGDCLLRRTMVGLNSTIGLNAVEAAAATAQQHLGWSPERAEQEVTSYRQDVQVRLKV